MVSQNQVIRASSQDGMNFNKAWKAPFLKLYLSQVFFLIEMGLLQFCLTWYLSQRTGSAILLTTLSTLILLPQILIGPFAGTLIDRVRRKMVMTGASVVLALVSLILIALFWQSYIQIWHLMSLLFIGSTAGVFYTVAVQASTSLMVPTESLSRVMGWILTIQGIIGVIVPLSGAFLLGFAPVQFVLIMIFVTGGLTLLLVTSLKFPEPRNHCSSTLVVRDFLDDFNVGLRYVYAWRGLRWVILMAMLFHFFIIPAFALKALLVTKYFQGNVYQLGLLDAVLNVGMITGGSVLGAWGGFRNKAVTSLIGLILTGLGLGLIGFKSGTAFTFSLVGMLMIGFMKPMIGGPLTALMQSSVAPEMQGRVLTIFNSLCQAITPLSMLLAGPFSERFGILGFYITGAVFIVGIGFVGFFIPDLVHLEERATMTRRPQFAFVASKITTE